MNSVSSCVVNFDWNMREAMNRVAQCTIANRYTLTERNGSPVVLVPARLREREYSTLNEENDL